MFAWGSVYLLSAKGRRIQMCEGNARRRHHSSKISPTGLMHGECHHVAMESRDASTSGGSEDSKPLEGTDDCKL